MRTLYNYNNNAEKENYKWFLTKKIVVCSVWFAFILGSVVCSRIGKTFDWTIELNQKKFNGSFREQKFIPIGFSYELKKRRVSIYCEMID